MKKQRLESTENGIAMLMLPLGFEITHLVYLPCGERVAAKHVAEDDAMAFVVEHRDHVNGMDEDERVETRRNAWRSKR